MHVEQSHDRDFPSRLELNVVAKPNQHVYMGPSCEPPACGDEMQKLSRKLIDSGTFFLAVMDHKFDAGNSVLCGRFAPEDK